MITYTRLGFLVLIIWIGSLMGSSQIVPKLISNHIPWFSIAYGVFITAAIVSAPVVYLLGKILNREKVERIIKPFGKTKTVYWGTHTFCMFPVEHWAVIIPVVTAITCAIMFIV